MKKITQKTTRAFSVPSFDKKSIKAKAFASRRFSFAVEHILFSEENLLEKTKKINSKKTAKSGNPKDDSTEPKRGF